MTHTLRVGLTPTAAHALSSELLSTLPPVVETHALFADGARGPYWTAALQADLDALYCALFDADDLEDPGPVVSYLVGRGTPVLFRCREEDGLRVPARGVTVVSAFSPAEIVAFLDDQVTRYRSESTLRQARALVEEAGYSPNALGLAHAVALNHSAAVEALLGLGVPVDARDARGTPVINIAIRHRAWDALELIMAKQPDVNAVATDRKSTALLELAATDRADLVDRLLAAGALVNVRNAGGQTPLMVAIGAKNVPVAQTLVGAGADGSIKDDLGMTAVGYARLFQLSDIVDALS